MTFDQAIKLFAAHYGNGIGQPMQPSKSLSTYNDKMKRWNLRNVRGLLAFVSASGKVWSFQDTAA
jgi:hypothetical protein